MAENIIHEEPTPGPWMECAESGEWWIAPTANLDIVICGTMNTSAADTALICAAPDLLAACEMALADYEAEYDKAYFGNDGQRRIDMGARIRAVKAALTKARGQ